MTGAQALAGAVASLRAAGISDPGRDARRLLAFALDIAADRVTLVLQDPVPNAANARFSAAVLARAAHQPIAQITGRRAFFGRQFRVTQDVLDPRPETETLVLEALTHPAGRILDLGTGSGCILLTLLAELPNALGLGTDVSQAALDVAADNAAELGVSGRVQFRLADWTDDLSEQYDLIVSNPPYIGADEMASLSPDVRDWEPHLALTPGKDALAAYRRILPGASRLLAPGGRLLVEIGPTQGKDVASIAKSCGYEEVGILSDLDGRDRVVVGTAKAI